MVKAVVDHAVAVDLRVSTRGRRRESPKSGANLALARGAYRRIAWRPFRSRSVIRAVSRTSRGEGRAALDVAECAVGMRMSKADRQDLWSISPFFQNFTGGQAPAPPCSNSVALAEKQTRHHARRLGPVPGIGQTARTIALCRRTGLTNRTSQVVPPRRDRGTMKTSARSEPCRHLAISRESITSPARECMCRDYRSRAPLGDSASR